MNKFILLAAGLLALGATSANAEVWSKDRFPYAREKHRICQEKAKRLANYEKRATADGHLSKTERRTMEVLKRDLDGTCKGYRWH